MAIAGLHNVPALETSMFRESQSSSSSGQRGNRGSISTRASSILQMWRELEDECVVNRARERLGPRFHREGSFSPRGGVVIGGGLEDSSESENGSLINSESQIVHMNDHEDRRSLTSEQSLDLGEVERERVRKIFREWMGNGENAESPRVAQINRSSRGQCVGDNEMESDRVVRNWVQTSSNPRGACVWSREDRVANSRSQFEQVQGGQVVNLSESQPETRRRQIRKLCGRQALLDLLAKNEQERSQELQCLEGSRPVSSFAHRNRIQSLLRLRSFQNRGSSEVRRPTSPAESELGMLRQRQTVSGLREGFLSRLDNNAHVQASGASVCSSENDLNAFRDDRTQANCASEILDGVRERNDSSTEVLIVGQEENYPVHDMDIIPSTDPLNRDPGVGSLADPNHPMDCNEGRSSQESDTKVEGRLECDLNYNEENRLETVTSVISESSSNDGILFLNFQETPRTESGPFTVVEENQENTHDQYPDMEESILHNELDDQVDTSINGNGYELDVPGEEEQVFEREWETSFSNLWTGDQVETDGLHLLGNGEAHSHGAIESEVAEQIDMQEDYWHENGSQETPRDWLGMASDSRLGSNQDDTYYFSDDDNVHHIELRELVNRRTVSSLLHSDFRESLDQIVQSYVERQNSVPDDWERHEMLPPPFVSRNQSQQYSDDDSRPNYTHANGSERILPPPPPPMPQQGHWGHGIHQTNWARQEVRQRPGADWEIINDLRVDMARLQQRLNNMQRMLETCMDMQLELQRSVRQEVSLALSRGVNPSGTYSSSESIPLKNSLSIIDLTKKSLEITLPNDSLKWDCVRKGVCCICSNTNIDSLLYRCGHMCTCTKCAEVLVEGNGKCPMCQAPVIEVIRAYFIQ